MPAEYVPTADQRERSHVAPSAVISATSAKRSNLSRSLSRDESSFAQICGSRGEELATKRGGSYIARQLYDFQHGTRAGAWSPLMANVVANLAEEDIVSVVAYLTSLPP